MSETIYTGGDAECELTTDHAASSYGIPVLVTGGDAHGPEDTLPSGILAGDLVADWLSGDDPSFYGEWAARTPAGIDLAHKFLGRDITAWAPRAIKLLRALAGLTQEQLAAKVGCSVQAINKQERGHCSASPAVRKLLTQVARDGGHLGFM